MTLFLANLLLALLWAAIQGSFTLFDLLVGFACGYLVLLVARPVLDPSSYYFGLWRAVAFAAIFAWELVLSSLRVARQVLTPRLHMRPGVIAVPLDVRTDAQITLLANLNSVTPGSLSLDVSDDRRTLYVHVMDIVDGDVDATRREIKEGLERRILDLLP